MNYISEQKQLLRRQMRELKKQYSATDLQQLSAQSLSQLELRPEFSAANNLLLYYSLSDEVFTHQFIEKWYKEKQIYLPVIEGDELNFYPFSGSNHLQSGIYNIQEPAVTERFNKEKKNTIIIVPGMAFDRQGNRLGRGKGFYDRFLQHFDGTKIGLCFSFQLLETVPTEPTDQKMDVVIYGF